MSGRKRAARGMAWLAWVLVPAGLLLVAGANAHLIYVAVQSQPDCVDHAEGRGRGPRLSRRQAGVLRRREMSETDKSYWLLSETSGIGETRDPRLDGAAAAGRAPLAVGGMARPWTGPASSLAYGVGVFLLSVAFVWTLVAFGRDYILFPSLAGFMIVAPFLAIGLYEKSRAIEEGRHIGFGSMLLVRPRAGAQIFFLGLLLCLLMLLWMRAAVLLYALFFGVTPFPGSTASSACSSARHTDGRCSWSERRSEACSRRSPSRSAYSRCR